ncbi:hypothetical protein [Methylobacterium oryzae]|uniref:hypothetical protein n=1 Tax=Methylobacterium oryzae TaxID=334852 RepID=UPI001F33C6A5|nr:hypothetical protein [Methylobacterium oryzae]UIN36929.1 hypothetical protein LXM90_10705 [Methylobacterium oryzae]
MSIQVATPAHVAIATAPSQCLGNIHGSANKAAFVIESLTKAGFEIVRKDALPEGVVRIHKSDAGRVETRTPAPWVLASVTPGVVEIRPSSTVYDHVIEATATALLTRGDFSERREIKVQTAWFCNEGGIEESTREAVSLALWQARKGAAAFIAATASDPASTDGEAA